MRALSSVCLAWSFIISCKAFSLGLGGAISTSDFNTGDKKGFTGQDEWRSSIAGVWLGPGGVGVKAENGESYVLGSVFTDTPRSFGDGVWKGLRGVSDLHSNLRGCGDSCDKGGANGFGEALNLTSVLAGGPDCIGTKGGASSFNLLLTGTIFGVASSNLFALSCSSSSRLFMASRSALAIASSFIHVSLLSSASLSRNFIWASSLAAFAAAFIFLDRAEEFDTWDVFVLPVLLVPER